jgi:hypothetical protein
MTTKEQNQEATVAGVAFEMAKYIIKENLEETKTSDDFLKLYSKCFKAASGQRVTA